VFVTAIPGQPHRKYRQVELHLFRQFLSLFSLPEESRSSAVSLHTHGPPAEPSVASSLQDTTKPEATTGFTTSNKRLFVHCHPHPVAGRPQHRTAPATIFFVFRSLFYTCATAPL
jgi:hypothetical protein